MLMLLNNCRVINISLTIQLNKIIDHNINLCVMQLYTAIINNINFVYIICKDILQ